MKQPGRSVLLESCLVGFSLPESLNWGIGEGQSFDNALIIYVIMPFCYYICNYAFHDGERNVHASISSNWIEICL